MKIYSMLLTAAMSSAVVFPAFAEEKYIEVIHHWVSESEAAALKTVKDDLAKKGIAWKDSAVGGASGANASQALRARLVAGDPPGAMQFVGFEAVTWSQEGALRDLTDIATAGGWAKVLPAQILPFVAPGGKWTTVPINMHRDNWVWGNAKAFKDAGVEPPKTWDELIASGEKFRKIGVIPLAISDEGWQVAKIYDSLMIDTYGPEFYKKAVVDLDDATLRGPEMVKVFQKLRQVRGLADENFAGRDWAVATGMVASGKAAMQVMGDWAKGEFLGKGMKAGKDFLCFPTPAVHPNYLFLMDAFGMFTSTNSDIKDAQDALAATAMDPNVQLKFNLLKGSIPARRDVDLSSFDDCAKESLADREAAIKSGSMYGSLSEGFGNQAQFSSVFLDVVGKFFVTDMSAENAVKQLADGIDNAR
jgi:glucose/mannose transport system substrate-binding protein